MISVKTQHFSLNRIFLLVIGLWPYQRSNLVQCQFILLLITMISLIVFQMATFITFECTTDLFMNVLCSVLCFFPIVTKYSSFYINAQSLRYLLEQYQRIYNGLKDENELAIIKKYECDGKRYTTNITLLTMSSILILVVPQFLPDIINVVLSINESRSRQLWFMAEYFIDQDKYYYLILLHMETVACTGALTIGATGSMLFVFLKHACGMFSIASYRFKQMMTTGARESNFTHKITMEERIFRAVDIHRKAMEYSTFLSTSFQGLFCLLIAFGVLCLSLNFFRVFQLISQEDNTEELAVRVLIVIAIIFYMFVANYAAQEITDHNEYVYFTAYNVQWYTAPLPVQKTILFLLQRSSKTFKLYVSGLFSGSLESFATLISTSVSYFTVIYSVRQ